MSEPEETWVEEFQLKGEEVLAKVKELVREGNVRRIMVSDSEGKTLLEIPLTVGVVGALLLPPLAALGAVAALLSECTITVVRQESPEEPTGDGG
jgi:aryl-alcohol dehydrogenase-like predicted oxidoreductase